MDLKQKVMKQLNDMDGNARTRHGDELLREIEREHDAPREALEQIIADWMAGEKHSKNEDAR